MTVVMRTDQDRGRLLGALTLLQMVGLIVPFVLLLPVVTPPGEWLESAARSASRVTTGVLLLVVNGAVTITISILAWPVFRRSHEALALWLLVLAGLWLAMQAVDNVHILSMLSLSESSVHAGEGAMAESTRAIAGALGVSRRWAHVTSLLAVDAWILCFYLNLTRANALPRAVAAFGLLTVIAHLFAIPVPSLLGMRAVAQAGMPMALSHVVTAWCLWRRGWPAPGPQPLA